MRKLLHHTFGCAVFLELRRGDDFGARPVLKFAIGETFIQLSPSSAIISITNVKL